MRKETVLKAFSFERAGFLMRNRFLEDMGACLIVLGVVAGNNLLSLILSGYVVFNRPVGTSGGTIWSVVLWAGGILLAGRAFRQMHDGRGGSDWLLLPATPLEKYSAAFASYALAYPILASLAVFILSAALEGIARVFHAAPGAVFNPLALLSAQDIVRYIVFISLTLAASARFAKLPIVKAGAIATTWGLILILIFTGALILFTPEGRQVLVRNHGRLDLQFHPSSGEEPILEWLMRLSCYVTGAFAVAYGYFRVAEKEAVDEVQ